jgi:hypothetical protein
MTKTAPADPDKTWKDREEWTSWTTLFVITFVALAMWTSAECRAMTSGFLAFLYTIFGWWWHEGVFRNTCGTISKTWKWVYVLWTLGVPVFFFWNYIYNGYR